MQSYVCHKKVNAKPMTRGEYNTLRGWTIPPDESPDDAGYLVEYPDGGSPNHPDYKNYISWAPADVFERGYTLEPTNFQDRVRAEKAKLDEDRAKLFAFCTTATFNGLPPDEQDRMKHQYEIQTELSALLGERIVNFKEA